MSTSYELQPLIVGIYPAFPLDKFIHASPDPSMVSAPCIAWLARGSDGSLVLVDTGPAMPTKLTERFHIGLDVRPEHRIDNALRAAGVEPEQITTVLLTHLHYDHCGHGEHLPNATFYVQRRELEYAVLPHQHQRPGYEVGYPGVIPSWMAIFDRIVPVSGAVEIAPGCTMLPLPGHTPGSAGAVFTTPDGRVAAVGDLVNRIENWQHPDGGHAAPALFTDLNDCRRSFELLEAEADSVLASHDFRVTDVSPTGRAS